VPAAPGGGPATRFRLVAFDSCADALAGLKKAAGAVVGPWGIDSVGGGASIPFAAGGAERAGAVADRSAAAPAAAPPVYSGTNTHEAGVDEPDLVKTDGRRIVTVTAGVLRVVDTATKRVTGTLDLAGGREDSEIRWAESTLLLHGDRALVLIPDFTIYRGGIVDGPGRPVAPGGERAAGPRIVLVDLGGAPRELGTLTFDGGLVDARQVGGTARVVVRSAPRLQFPYQKDGNDRRTDEQRTADNRKVIEQSTVEQWLPRYRLDQDGRVTDGQIGCERVSRPAVYSGTSMLSVLSFDLGAASLGDGDPTTIVADGSTVYSNGPSLYVSNDRRWQFAPRPWAATDRVPDPVTEIYRFDISQPGAPRFAASGTVPGWLLNQYALSEWNGHLRVATTTGLEWDPDPGRKTSSSVHVLRERDGALVETGSVTGLGTDERIYSVRFVGPVGYVVTFRQTDPLYTVDLSDPERPRTVGELKITGYSAYLHPVDDARLIGIGQEASTQGRVQGTQVSLFDVHDLSRPARLAQHHVRGGHSEAEFDPHAFLYWAPTGTLVVPLTTYGKADGRTTGGALVLGVSGNTISERGMVSNHEPTDPRDVYGSGMIRRSLMVGDVLWTVSSSGLRATDAASLSELAWLRF
jgi:hypothetical protein